jgi:tRNA (guanine-N7-)-methyltransferase
MSRKRKKEKFAQLDEFGNVFQNFDPQNPKLVNNKKETINFKGKWNEQFFKMEAPIILELACGKGEYTIGLAVLNKANNYFGVDIKGNRIWKGAKYAIENQMNNVGFIRTPIHQLSLFFEKNEVSEIWITFPDPQVKKSKWKKRLTSSVFLESYKKFLKPGGLVHLKTDSDLLFEFTLETLKEMKINPEKSIPDVYGNHEIEGVLGIQTFYEKMHLEAGKTIKYVSFLLN